VGRFGSIESIVSAAETSDAGFPAGSKAKVLAAREYLLVAPAAVRGRTDVPIPEDLDDALPAQAADADGLAELAGLLGIENSVKRVQTAIAKALAA
jgi:hypothetical protein